MAEAIRPERMLTEEYKKTKTESDREVANGLYCLYVNNKIVIFG